MEPRREVVEQGHGAAQFCKGMAWAGSGGQETVKVHRNGKRKEFSSGQL